tara:strand:+ start:4456 stop:5790 length:1335 start_codon:yes stop_codon:yes gene_type:complete
MFKCDGSRGLKRSTRFIQVVFSALACTLISVDPHVQAKGIQVQESASSHQTTTHSTVATTAEETIIATALEHLHEQRLTTASFLSQLATIVSPSGHEHERAEAVAHKMRAVGLESVVVDDTPNVIGVIPGRSEKSLIFVATLDDLATVAVHQKAATKPPKIDGNRLVGPGTNTSSTSAAILAAAAALITAGFQPKHDLVFAAVAQEETGLVGMKALYEQYKDRAIGFIDVLGDGRRISYGAIGIHWWKIIAEGPPGHSLSGGLPNVNQGIARAVDRILQLPHPETYSDSRTVINVSVLQSGSVFNHKPSTGWFSLDIRSLDNKVIQIIETAVQAELLQISQETGITLTMEAFQLTPGGQIPGARMSRLVTTAEAIAKYLRLEPTVSNRGSSNMNVAIGNGTPAIGLGGSRGGDRAQSSEWADITAMMRTASHVVLLAAILGMSD